MATILGTLSLLLLPKDLLPSANLPAVQILSFYAGMPVEHVEQDLTYLFERYTGQAVGIESQESRSLMGVSIVKNYFNSSIDLSNAIAQTGSLVMSVLRKLPPGTQPPLILPFDPMASVPLALAQSAAITKKRVSYRISAATGCQIRFRAFPERWRPPSWEANSVRPSSISIPRSFATYQLGPGAGDEDARGNEHLHPGGRYEGRKVRLPDYQ